MIILRSWKGEIAPPTPNIYYLKKLSMSRTGGQFPRQTHKFQFLEAIKYKSNEIGYNFHNLRFRLRENQTPVDFFRKNTHNLVLFQQKFIENFFMCLSWAISAWLQENSVTWAAAPHT